MAEKQRIDISVEQLDQVPLAGNGVVLVSCNEGSTRAVVLICF